MVRIPPELHRRLTMEAAEAGISLNRLTSDHWLLITASGLAGSIFDFLLGATVQAIYFCPKDQKETERHPLHTCGTETVHLRGWKWLTNDWVNLGCGAMGALVVLGLGML